jgi:hypothetical protein
MNTHAPHVNHTESPSVLEVFCTVTQPHHLLLPGREKISILHSNFRLGSCLWRYCIYRSQEYRKGHSFHEEGRRIVAQEAALGACGKSCCLNFSDSQLKDIIKAPVPDYLLASTVSGGNQNSRWQVAKIQERRTDFGNSNGNACRSSGCVRNL